MRKQRYKTGIVLMVLYLLGVIAGCFIIWAIPFYKSQADLVDIAADKGMQIIAEGDPAEVMTYGMDFGLYTSDGSVVYKENNFMHISQWREIKNYVPMVLEKGKIFVPISIKLDNREEEPKEIFGALIGTVIEKDDGQIYVSLLIRNFSNLDTSMLTYFVLFTLLYVLGALFLQRTIKKERELNRMRRDLIANVSHELKTPITAIRAMAEALHDGMVKDERELKIYSGKIMEESEQLEQLVLDILELSRLQSKRTDFKKENVCLESIITPIVDRYMMLCGDLGITLDISGLILSDVPMVYTDAEKLITLMNILLDNAVKFTDAGGTIWFSNQVGAKNVTFCIRDTGEGIREEDIDRIFDRFYKVDTAHNSGGSGLGLAIADEIAKGLNEQLWVESKYAVGSSFYFTVSY